MEPGDVNAPDRLRVQPSWLVNQVGLHASRLVNDGLAAVDARRYHYALLAALDEIGEVSQAELSRRTTIDRSDVVAAINELADQGYVERSPDSVDRRRNVITITPAGRRRLRQLDKLLDDVQDSLLEPLSRKERDQFVSTLARLFVHHAKH